MLEIQTQDQFVGLVKSVRRQLKGCVESKGGDASTLPSHTQMAEILAKAFGHKNYKTLQMQFEAVAQSQPVLGKSVVEGSLGTLASKGTHIVRLTLADSRRVDSDELKPELAHALRQLSGSTASNGHSPKFVITGESIHTPALWRVLLVSGARTVHWSRVLGGRTLEEVIASIPEELNLTAPLPVGGDGLTWQFREISESYEFSVHSGTGFYDTVNSFQEAVSVAEMLDAAGDGPGYVYCYDLGDGFVWATRTEADADVDADAEDTSEAPGVWNVVLSAGETVLSSQRMVGTREGIKAQMMDTYWDSRLDASGCSPSWSFEEQDFDMEDFGSLPCALPIKDRVFSAEEFKQILAQDYPHVDVIVGVPSSIFGSGDIEEMNDYVSALLTGSECGLEDLGYTVMSGLRGFGSNIPVRVTAQLSVDALEDVLPLEDEPDKADGE